MRTVYSRNTAPHKPLASELPGVFYIGGETVSLATNLAKGGGGEVVR